MRGRLTRATAVIAVVLVSAVSACATPGPPRRSVEEWASRTMVEDSALDSDIRIVSAELDTVTPRGSRNDKQRFFLRSWKNKTSGVIGHQLYVDIWHQDSGARHYTDASFIGGARVDVAVIGYRPNCAAGGGNAICSHDETFAVPLTTEQLKIGATSDLQVRVNSQAGVFNVLTIPGPYIEAHLRGVAEAAGIGPDREAVTSEPDRVKKTQRGGR